MVLQEDVLRFVLNSLGQPFVMFSGIIKMQVCCVGSLDFLLMVIILMHYIIEKIFNVDILFLLYRCNSSIWKLY